jgi:hypothetical protein
VVSRSIGATVYAKSSSTQMVSSSQASTRFGCKKYNGRDTRQKKMQEKSKPSGMIGQGAPRPSHCIAVLHVLLSVHSVIWQVDYRVP